jgi:hypothetical protein
MTVRDNSGISVRRTASRAHNAVGRVRRISDLPWWSALCLVAALSALCLQAALSTSASADDSWQIRILPATKLRLAQAPAPHAPAPAQPAPAPQEPGSKPAQKAYEPAPAPAAAPASAPAAGGLRIIPGHPHSAGPARASYSDVYHSIPFSRAEYVAHPSYRSEATLGLMLGQMPYPATGEPAVAQYGYVAPYLYDNTYGTPTSYNVIYSEPLGW